MLFGDRFFSKNPNDPCFQLSSKERERDGKKRPENMTPFYFLKKLIVAEHFASIANKDSYTSYVNKQIIQNPKRLNQFFSNIGPVANLSHKSFSLHLIGI